MRSTGLTLIEVLVTLVIIGIAFAALAMTQITNLKVTRDSKQASIAMQVANIAMERATKQVLDASFGCSGEPPNRVCLGSYNSTGTYTDLQAEGGSYSAMYNIAFPAGTAAQNLAGMALIEIQVIEPKPVSFTQLVSCMDIVPPPAFNKPAPCPKLVVP